MDNKSGWIVDLKIGERVRQGDVWVTRVKAPKSKPKGEVLSDKDRLVLEYGEVTGHAHAVYTPQIGDIYAEVFDGEPVKTLKLKQPAVIAHEEHDHVRLPKGTFRVRRQREYTPEGWDYVAD